MERIDEPVVRVKIGTVREVMRQSVVVLEPETPAGEAARLLERAGVAGAPVVRGDQVIGVISRSDLLARARDVSPHAQESGPFLRYEQVLDSTELTVEALMTPHVVAARVDWPAIVAALTMQAEGFNRLPVLDANDRLVGIIARDDVIAAVARAARSGGGGLRPTLPPD
jgi:CBS domain-containing protein